MFFEITFNKCSLNLVSILSQGSALHTQLTLAYFLSPRIDFSVSCPTTTPKPAGARVLDQIYYLDPTAGHVGPYYEELVPDDG